VLRYEIVQASPTSLKLGLLLDEVPKTTLNPCTQDADCQPDLEHGKNAGGTGSANRVFSCVDIPAQAGHAGGPRCVQRCDPNKGGDSDCRPGNVCENLSGAGYLCVEAPPIDPECFPQPMTTYSVHAGKSYIVNGQSMPTLHTTQVSASEVCVPVTDDPVLARIPFSAPKCPDSFLALPLAAPSNPNFPHPQRVQDLSVQDLASAGGSNPCLYRGVYLDGDPAPDPSNPPVSAYFANPQIRFVLTNLNEYAGDLVTIHFEFQYGFIPLIVQIPTYEVQLTMGVGILTGPTQTPESPVRRNAANITYPYLYVIDQGRTALTPGSRGQILRINPRSGSNEIVTFDTTYSGSTPFQIQ